MANCFELRCQLIKEVNQKHINKALAIWQTADFYSPGGCTRPAFGRGRAIEVSKTYPFLIPIFEKSIPDLIPIF